MNILDDSVFSIPVFSPVCASVHLHLRQIGRHCNAFPDETIPMDIWMGRNDHRIGAVMNRCPRFPVQISMRLIERSESAFAVDQSPLC